MPPIQVDYQRFEYYSLAELTNEPVDFPRANQDSNGLLPIIA